MRTSTPPEQPPATDSTTGTDGQVGLPAGGPDLSDLPTRDLITQLSHTKDQTRAIRHDTLNTPATGRLLAHQHALLTELRKRTTPTGQVKEPPR